MEGVGKMSKYAAFVVAYDGDALKNHLMDVRDLAPALLSIGLLFDEANRALNGDQSSVKLHVKALQEGSFEIAFEVFQTLKSQLIACMTGEIVTSAINLKEILLFSGGGLFLLIKKLKGKNPEKIIDLKNGFCLIELNRESFEVPLNLLRIYQDIAVRSAVEKVLSPLKQDGIDSFSVKDGDCFTTYVEKAELNFFKTPEEQDEMIVEVEHEAAYSIISLAFKDDNKWRLSDGHVTITALIKDEEFLNKVNSNAISFCKGDVLICQVKVTQWRTKNVLRTEYSVLKIKEHKPAMRQLTMF